MKIAIDKIKTNPDNPRVIKDDKFKKLVQSIKDFPDMLEKRPIVIDEDNIVLGGNMRLRALKELKYTEIPVIVAKGWTDEQKKEFIIKDNVGFGEWDWDILANEWSDNPLTEWGLDVWQPEDVDLSEFFEEDTNASTDPTNKIMLEYNEEDHGKIVAKFDSIGGSKESIVWKLLGL